MEVPSAAEDHLLGTSVAIDGSTIVVGATRPDDNRESDAGAAYVFTRAVDGWSAPSTNVILTAPDGKTGDGFGQSVTVDGDSIVVGAPWADTASGMDVGAAYVFTRPADGWSATDSGVELTSSTAQSFDHFGTSVDIDGDTIAIGAPHALSRLVIRCGSVHLFTRPAGGWAESSDSFQFSTCDRVSEGFGYSVDLDGDSVVMGVLRWTHLFKQH